MDKSAQFPQFCFFDDFRSGEDKTINDASHSEGSTNDSTDLRTKSGHMKTACTYIYQQWRKMQKGKVRLDFYKSKEMVYDVNRDGFMTCHQIYG